MMKNLIKNLLRVLLLASFLFFFREHIISYILDQTDPLLRIIPTGILIFLLAILGCIIEVLEPFIISIPKIIFGKISVISKIIFDKFFAMPLGPGGIDLNNPRNYEIGNGPLGYINPQLVTDVIPKLDVERATEYDMLKGLPDKRGVYQDWANQVGFDFRVQNMVHIYTNDPVTGQCKNWNSVFKYKKVGDNAYVFAYTDDIRRDIRAHNRPR